MWTLPSHYVYLQQFISECRCLIPCALNIHSDEVSVKTLQSFLFYCKVEMKKVPRILWNIWTPGLRKWNRTSLKSRLGIFSLKKVICQNENGNAIHIRSFLMTRVGLFLNTEMSKPCFFTFYCTRKFLVTTIGHLAAKNSYLVASWHP